MAAQTTEEQLIAAELELEAAEVAKDSLVAEQLRSASAVSIEGHPNAEYNGLFTHDSASPVALLKNDNGISCYYHKAADSWYLKQRSYSREAKPDLNRCQAASLR